MALTPDAIRTFTAVADTILPPVPGGPGRSTPVADLGLPERLPDLYALLPDDRARRDLDTLLGLFGRRATAFALYGTPTAFADLDAGRRAAALQRMSSSRIPPVRQGFKAIKTLIGYLFSTAPPGTSDWPVWEAMGYPGPGGPPPAEPKRLTPLVVDRPTALTCDVVIVGSGAGGGVAAGVLAAAGLEVVVLEKGGYHNEADFTHYEAEAYRDMYLDGALSATADGGVTMLAGSTVGGGTVINYSTSFATPARVRAEWDRVSGLNGTFTGPEYEASSQAVHERAGVNRDHNEPSNRERLLEKGLRDLGWHVDEMPRNVAGCTPEECGWCGLGCRSGAKQSTLRTWLEDAASAGARIVAHADTQRVLLTSGRATGVEAFVGPHPLTVRARAVVLAAGAPNTPAILLRSGIARRTAGHNLRLHPVTAVWGRFAEPVDPWTGIMQALYSDQFADLDGQGYGFKFETAAVHPVFPAMFFPWGDGGEFRTDLLDLRHWSPVGILLRDKGGGRVGVRRDGRPVWKYRLGADDTRHLREGVLRAAEVLAAAGAEEILASTIRPVRWRLAAGGSAAGFRDEVDTVGYGPNQTTYLTFHQMGSARMGADPRTSVVDGDNQVHGVPGLFVLDGSAFPTASGVNPMVSIKTIAHRGARALAGSLT